jgi:hypothetical protein
MSVDSLVSPGLTTSVRRPAAPLTRAVPRVLVVVFGLALALHLRCATLNWRAGFLPGHEFRQSQTALISYYIDQQDNFSLRYETPLFGKPWVANPLELPIYEWAVVLLSRATGWPHHLAARTISLSCFYLTLPALYLLLGFVGLAPTRRLLALALVLTCPVYLFYSRAFLMESMVLMAASWFLVCFGFGLRTRDARWLLGSWAAGTIAAVMKSTTFAVWLLPAAAATLAVLRADARRGAGWRALGRTAAWSIAAVAGPLAALSWWIRFTDAIKAVHPSAYIFTSTNLSVGNFGLLDLATRCSPATWSTLLARWGEAIMPAWLIGVLLAIGLALPRVRAHVLGAAGLFLAAQLLFPHAYALQEYYFYACAVFLSVALAWVLLGLLDSPLPRRVVWPVVAIPLVAQFGTYWSSYRVLQTVVSEGGTGLDFALRAYTPPGSVIIVAGNDWAAMIPYYAQRKALMIRNGLEQDPRYLERALADLADEDVSALVLVGAERRDHALVVRAAARFNLDLTPTFSHPTADVYLNRLDREGAITRLRNGDHYDQVTTVRRAYQPDPGPPAAVSRGTAVRAFRMIWPRPSRCAFLYGYSVMPEGDREVLGAHPDTDVWVPAPATATEIVWEFGFFAGAYAHPEAATDGVEFVITGETAAGGRRELYRRLLDPLHQPADRGLQSLRLPYRPHAGETLVFSTRRHGTLALDWVYWRRVVVH